jgi:hypothetical protein|tara:strand:+ start:620 stop:739 length:120 start_codon:yes stop_codon:yes gene_type:complete
MAAVLHIALRELMVGRKIYFILGELDVNFVDKLGPVSQD